jgi:hypothetical protein
MDNQSLYYRLQYSQAQRLQAYATQRWVDSPPRLFDARLRDAVSGRGALTWFGDGSVPALKVDLLAFEQVFDSATASRGVVRARATVYHKGLIGQKTFVAEQPAPSADGAGGVKALSTSSDAVIAAILDWAATLPLAPARRQCGAAADGAAVTESAPAVTAACIRTHDSGRAPDISPAPAAAATAAAAPAGAGRLAAAPLAAGARRPDLLHAAGGLRQPLSVHGMGQ